MFLNFFKPSRFHSSKQAYEFSETGELQQSDLVHDWSFLTFISSEFVMDLTSVGYLITLYFLFAGITGLSRTACDIYDKHNKVWLDLLFNYTQNIESNTCSYIKITFSLWIYVNMIIIVVIAFTLHGCLIRLFVLLNA